MKNIPLFLFLLLMPLLANAQKYVGTWYGAIPGASNAPPNIATNGSAAANGTILQKTGDRLQLTTTITNLNIGTAIVTVVYGPYTNLAGYFNAEGRFVGTNNLAVASITNTVSMGAKQSFASTNWFGNNGGAPDGNITTVGGNMYFSQGAGNTYIFGQSAVLGDGHVFAADFNGSGAALTGLQRNSLIGQFGGENAGVAGGVKYFSFNGKGGYSDDPVFIGVPMTTSGTASNMWVNLGYAATLTNYTAILVKNSSLTTLSCTVLAGPTPVIRVVSNLTATVSYVAGDIFSLAVTNSSGINQAIYGSCRIDY